MAHVGQEIALGLVGGFRRVDRQAQFALAALLLGQIDGDAEIADHLVVFVAQRAQRQQHRERAAVLADVGPFAGVAAPQRGQRGHRLERRRHRHARLRGHVFCAPGQLLRIQEQAGGLAPDHLVRGIAEHGLGGGVEQGDGAVRVGGHDRVAGVGQDRALQRRIGDQFAGALRHLLFQRRVEFQHPRLGTHPLGHVVQQVRMADDVAVVVRDRRGAGQHVEHMAVAMPQLAQLCAVAAGVAHLRAEQLLQWLADGLRSGVTEDAFGGWIPVGDAAMQVLGDDRLAGAADQRGQLALLA